MENLDPAADGYVLQRLGIAETLVDATEEAVPGLASGRTTSEDGPTWRFEIREGVTVHDGDALTAEASAAALDRAAHRPGLLDETPVSDIRPEDGAVVIETSGPFGALPSIPAHSTAVNLAPAS